MTQLTPFAPSIWVGKGPVVPFVGFPYPTRMVVVRLADGGLFVWSPIAFTRELKAAVAGLGPVRFLVSPNALHHLFLGDWKAAYPEARLYASPGLRKKRKDIAFDADLGDTPDRAWAGDLDQAMISGGALDEVVFFHRASRTVIFTDMIENFPPGLVQGLAWPGRPPRRHRAAASRRAAGSAPQLPVPPPPGAGDARAHPRLADRAGHRRPWRHGPERRRRLRAPGLRLAAVAASRPKSFSTCGRDLTCPCR